MIDRSGSIVSQLRKCESLLAAVARSSVNNTQQCSGSRIVPSIW